MDPDPAPDPNPDPFISSSKNSKKNLDPNFFFTSFALFIFENDVNVLHLQKIINVLDLQKVMSRKTFLKRLVFGWSLEGQ
jgi:hypothetical protein